MGLCESVYSSAMIITCTLFPWSGFTSSWYFASGYSATVNGFVLDLITEHFAYINLAILAPIVIIASKA